MFNFQLKEMCQRLKENVETCKTWESLKRLHLNDKICQSSFAEKTIWWQRIWLWSTRGQGSWSAIKRSSSFLIPKINGNKKGDNKEKIRREILVIVYINIINTNKITRKFKMASAFCWWEKISGIMWSDYWAQNMKCWKSRISVGLMPICKEWKAMDFRNLKSVVYVKQKSN